VIHADGRPGPAKQGSRRSATFAEPYQDQFNLALWLPWGVLGALIVAMLVGTILAQKRKDAR